MCYYSILFLLELWHIAVMTNLKTTVNIIAKIAAVILALIDPNGEFLLTIIHLSDKPSEPEDLKATNVTSSSAGLQWRAPSNTGGLPITSYLVERRGKHWQS